MFARYDSKAGIIVTFVDLVKSKFKPAVMWMTVFFVEHEDFVFVIKISPFAGIFATDVERLVPG